MRMEETKYELIYNYGTGFEHKFLNRYDFIKETSQLLNRPKKIFLGMGNFLELGDYNNLLDSILFFGSGNKFEKILDHSNRLVSEWGDIPFAFFKLAVYFPDFLLKDVPTYCVSTIGKKSRLGIGAENFIKHIKKYDPLVLTAMPYEIAIEFIRRLDLDDEHLLSTIYKKSTVGKQQVYSGGIKKFISGDRKSIEIEKNMIDNSLTEDEVMYVGSGEAGIKTFSTIKNSVAFNPLVNIIPESSISLYGSSLESLLVLFNYDMELSELLLSKRMEEYIPSLVVFSERKEKSEELIEIELKHRQLQKNILAQRVVYSADSYDSVINEINIDFKGSPIGIEKVQEMINKRINKYIENPIDIVKEIYDIAKERYESIGGF